MEEPLPMKTKTRRQLVAHRDYTSMANRQTKIPMVFRGIFGIFNSISKLLFIHSMISRRTLAGKHGSKGNNNKI
jgi:hypothetical protein